LAGVPNNRRVVGECIPVAVVDTALASIVVDTAFVVFTPDVAPVADCPAAVAARARRRKSLELPIIV